ncbi:T9SS type B sorting domain-containing protein [Algibacter lectus]|uniref:T9SS type B sorting domain-containing protein n=1 Tax=Algibacter lectus TaxID=221126 RepID=UPI0026EAE8A1|nr:T9SS type B sorting domain-containing protein [Algibacter lectus]MDO7138529.1 T9SS type B sorting domain-containing protein [Algibacter lectus]
MQKKHIFSLLTIFCIYIQSHAQLCEGSLGDPIVEIDFGSGSNRGSALGSAITAFTYRASGELDEGEYTIVNSSSGLKANAWHVTNDHTGNSNGYMMVINSAVIANEGVFYTKTVSGLCPNTTYEFSAWLINLLNPNAGLTDQYSPNVTFRISDTSGNILGFYSTGDINQTSSPKWLQYGFFFTSGADAEVVISILNSAPSAHPGNDIALDDISFRPCGPTIINSIDNDAATALSICQNESVNYTFQADVSSGYTNPQYQWQLSDDNGDTWLDITGETAPNYLFSDTNTPGTFLYRLTVANDSSINSAFCRIASDNFEVEIITTPEALTGEAEQLFCTTQNPTIANIEVSVTAIWYDAQIAGNILPEETSLNDGVNYYAAKETINGCESDDRIAVLVNIVSPTLAINNISVVVCDNLNDDEEVIDFTIYEALLTNCSDCNFNFFTSQSGAENYYEDQHITEPTSYNWSIETPTIYARIDSANHCYQIAEITVSLQATPIIDIQDFIGMCEDDNEITVDAGNGFNTYLWSTGETTQTINIPTSNIGSYSITVTKDYATYTCSTTKNFEVVLSNEAIIQNIEIEDWTDTNNSITVNLSHLSLGDYEFSLDDTNYQDDNVFTRLPIGEYTIYVRDKNGCGTITENVYILNAPKYFTPNGDGFHDTWSIKYSETEETLDIKIYDRYGKLLKTLDKNTSWDGSYNGRNMPTSDYWFVVTRADGKNYTGHFTLKR